MVIKPDIDFEWVTPSNVLSLVTFDLTNNEDRNYENSIIRVWIDDEKVAQKKVNVVRGKENYNLWNVSVPTGRFHYRVEIDLYRPTGTVESYFNDFLSTISVEQDYIIEETSSDTENTNETTNTNTQSGNGSLCGVSDVTLFFQSSGIEVRPIELDSYEKSTKYNYAKVRVTQEAAQHIQQNYESKEVVSVVSNGTTVARYMIPDKDDTITTTDDTGYVRLEDPLKILSYTNINKKFHGKQTLEDVVDWIFARAKGEDNHGVLRDWSTSDEEFNDIEEWSSVGGFSLPLVSGIANNILQTLFEGKPLKKSSVNMDFEDEDALSCLNRVAENYGVPIWSNDSTLMFGSRQYDTTVYPAGLTRDHVALTGISAPNVRDPIKAVRVRGAAKNSSEQRKWEISKNDKGVRAEGAAVRTDLEDGEGVEVFFDARTTYDGDVLEDIARRKIRSTIGNESGSCTIDVLSTQKSGIDIKNLKLGDAIYVPEYKECRRPIEEGFYEVTGIHHKLSNWVGWNAILDLEDMNSGTINTESYFFDPTSEEFITDEDYDLGATLNFLLDESL